MKKFKYLKRFNESTESNKLSREDMIDTLYNTSTFDEEELKEMSDSELKELWDSLETDDWLENNEGSVNEFFGGPVKDLMIPRVDKLIEFLNKYREDLENDKMESGDEITLKVENMWNYLLHNMDLDTLSSAARQGEKVRGNGENIVQKVKRSIKNF